MILRYSAFFYDPKIKIYFQINQINTGLFLNSIPAFFQVIFLP